MSLLILHTLPEEVPSSRGTLTISLCGFRRCVSQPRRNNSCLAPFSLHQQCCKSHLTAQESISGSGRARSCCKPVLLPIHKLPCSWTASGKHPDPPKEQSEHRAKVGLTQGVFPQAPLSAHPGMLLRSWEKQEGKQQARVLGLLAALSPIPFAFAKQSLVLFGREQGDQDKGGRRATSCAPFTCWAERLQTASRGPPLA